jgi:hypothetical protein
MGNAGTYGMPTRQVGVQVTRKPTGFHRNLTLVKLALVNGSLDFCETTPIQISIEHVIEVQQLRREKSPKIPSPLADSASGPKRETEESFDDLV